MAEGMATRPTVDHGFSSRFVVSLVAGVEVDLVGVVGSFA